MLLEGMLWQDLNISLALNLEKVIVICGIPDPEPKQALKKNQRGSEGMMVSLRDLNYTQSAILFTGQDRLQSTYKHIVILPCL